MTKEADNIKREMNEKWGMSQAIQEALKHQVPSPETRERIKALEINQQNVMQEIQEIKQMIKDLGTKIDCALDKKADRWVEKVLWTVIGFIVTGFFSYIGILIIQSIIHFNK